MEHHETVVIRCDDIGARCGDVGARCGDVCVWGSDVDDRARSFDVTISALDAETSDGRRSARRRRRSRGVTGDIGDCGVGITPQMCNRVTNHGDKSTFFQTWASLIHCFVGIVSIYLSFWRAVDITLHWLQCQVILY